MNLFQQLKTALIDAPFQIKWIKANSFFWLLIYLVTGGIIFAGVSWALLHFELDIKRALLDYIFPRSWHELTEPLLIYFYQAQAKVVIGNMILGASLVIASIFLFPVKEMVSARAEQNFSRQAVNLNNREGQALEPNLDVGPNQTLEPLSLYEQFLEESRLLFLYLTTQMVILWIGYYPYDVTQWLSIGLSYIFLFKTFAIDFISPTLQRHRLPYARILRALLKRPLLLLSFGALYCAPAIVCAHFLFQIESLHLVEVAAYLFAINMLFLALAIPAGTFVALKLLQDLKTQKAWSSAIMKRIYIGLAVCFVVFGYLHSSLFKSLHHKSQILKAEYEFIWSSFDAALPSFDAFMNGKALSSFKITLQITNPTEIAIEVEDSVVWIEKFDAQVAQVDLKGFSIEPGQQKEIILSIDSLTDLTQLGDLTDLFEGWHMDIHLDIWPGIPVVINLIKPTPNKD
jgi:uncharacterized protein involved in cysteine biosynthesis